MSAEEVLKEIKEEVKGKTKEELLQDEYFPKSGGFNLEKKIGLPAMLELLGEESSELAQASLKLARILRGDMPTPVTFSEGAANLFEEMADVNLIFNEFFDRYDVFWKYVFEFIRFKRKRLKERLEDKH